MFAIATHKAVASAPPSLSLSLTVGVCDFILAESSCGV